LHIEDKMKFLRLTSLIINPSMINTIEIFPKKYVIHMTAAPIDGAIVVASGGLRSSQIDIHENTVDYDILSKWMDQCAPL
jgi:hypothetical protein